MTLKSQDITPKQKKQKTNLRAVTLVNNMAHMPFLEIEFLYGGS